jgi:hypothetical protein
MQTRSGNIILHLALRIGITALLVLCIVYPFLPGDYDSLALALSTMAQVGSAFGLLLVPVGGVWLAYELRQRTRRQRSLPAKPRGCYIALISVVVASVIALVVSGVAFAVAGPSLGLLTLLAWLYIVALLIPKLRASNTTASVNFNPVPLYLIGIPIAVTLIQLTLAAPATEFSRNRAISMSAELISDIEEYHARHGQYPASLLAAWKDYYPSVVGIEKFHYAPKGDAYNLFFEQPRFLFDNIGTREFVVYNPRDEHDMISHTSWILIFTPEELQRNQGWYAVHDELSPHWKYFWFD